MLTDVHGNRYLVQVDTGLGPVTRLTCYSLAHILVVYSPDDQIVALELMSHFVLMAVRSCPNPPPNDMVAYVLLTSYLAEREIFHLCAWECNVQFETLQCENLSLLL